MTKTGNGKSLLVVKTPEGKIEEWKFTFSDCGLLLVSRQHLIVQDIAVLFQLNTDSAY